MTYVHLRDNSADYYVKDTEIFAIAVSETGIEISLVHSRLGPLCLDFSMDPDAKFDALAKLQTVLDLQE